MLVVHARELLDTSHPLHGTFAKWVAARTAEASGHVVKGQGANLALAEPSLSVRQARKFLAVPAHRRYRKAA